MALESLQVTVRSFLGGIVGNCGGLLIDAGWLRVLGAGVTGLPGVHEANHLTGTPPLLLTIAWDVMGGQFAVNGGGLAAESGEVCYWQPDALEWLGLGLGYGAFIAWALSDQLEPFYTDLRWPGWEHEVLALDLDQGVFSYPPVFTKEGSDLRRARREAVPMTELHEALSRAALELAEVPDGGQLTIGVAVRRQP